MPEKILIIENEAIIAKDLQERISTMGYLALPPAHSPEEAWEFIKGNPPDLILMDIVLESQYSGVQLASHVREKYDIPVVFLTAYSDEATLQQAIETEPFGYLIKPFQERELYTTIRIALYKHKTEQRFKESLKQLKLVEEKLQQTNVQLKTSLEGTIKAMTMIIEIRDPFTAGHQRRVARLGGLIAEELGFNQDQLTGIILAGHIHDLGKICVPAEILSKPGKISEIERSMIKTHPQVGYDILKSIKFPWPIAEIIYQHHEFIDGSGYPNALQGKDIRPEAKILSVADILEAMSSHRPYRAAIGLDAAIEDICRYKGSRYDPAIVEVSLKLYKAHMFDFLHE